MDFVIVRYINFSSGTPEKFSVIIFDILNLDARRNISPNSKFKKVLIAKIGKARY